MTQYFPVVGQNAKIDQQILARFRETLEPDDQQALDALFHVTEQPAQSIPVELLLLTIMLEQQKTILFLVSRLGYYDQKFYHQRVKRQPDA